MNLTNILYDPYFIIIVISLIITLIAYFIIKNNKIVDEEPNYSKPLVITFVVSFVVLIGIKYGIDYMNKNNFFQKKSEFTSADKLTIVADDVDYDIMEN